MTDSGTLTVIQGDTHFRARDAREPGHFWADNELIAYLPKIGPNGFALYMLLAFHAKNNTGRSWPSVATLAKEMGVSEPTILKYTEILENEKLIVVSRPTSTSKTGKVVRHNCTYTLVSLKRQEAKTDTGGGKNILPGVVKDFDQGGKRALPGVVKDVYYNNTKNNKTKRTRRKKDSMSPVAIAPATVIEPSLPVGQGVAQNAIPSKPALVDADRQIPALPKGTEARYVSRQVDQESYTHIEHLVSKGVKTPTPVCKRCGEKLSGGIITQTPVQVSGIVYTRCVEPSKKPKAPAINKPLLDAIAEHIEKIDKGMANGYTGVLAGRAGTVWKRKLGIPSLTAENYASIARSIPRFVEWFAKECPGCNIRDADKFESRYTQFVGNNGITPPKPVPRRPGEVDPSDWVSVPHPDPDMAKLGITKSVHKSEVKHG